MKPGIALDRCSAAIKAFFEVDEVLAARANRGDASGWMEGSEMFDHLDGAVGVDETALRAGDVRGVAVVGDVAELLVMVDGVVEDGDEVAVGVAVEGDEANGL
ncbi:MAG: hypothetical protein CL912_09955 [Deltaproteobacteria bacterium]|nr:hypothetical protein [Deltaproteobacteria bacterium]